MLTLFHNNANLTDTAEGLTRRMGRSLAEVQQELSDMVALGELEKVEVYSFNEEKDREIQDAISKQLALSEIIGKESLGRENALQIPRITTGLEIIDPLLPEGLPFSSTVLILSEPGAGEENVLAHFVSQQIESGKAVIYVALDNFPANIRHNIQVRTAEKDVNWLRLRFVDCYSKTVGVESAEAEMADPEDLAAVSIAVSNIMTQTRASLIVLDSFNTILRKKKYGQAIEFLRQLIARTRQAKCLSLVTMNRPAFPPPIVAAAEDAVEGVIELKVEEKGEEIERSLRVFKMVGVKHSTAWVRYEISDGDLVSPEEHGS